jgi:hypothetical protein
MLLAVGAIRPLLRAGFLSRCAAATCMLLSASGMGLLSAKTAGVKRGPARSCTRPAKGRGAEKRTRKSGVQANTHQPPPEAGRIFPSTHNLDSACPKAGNLPEKPTLRSKFSYIYRILIRTPR